MVTIISLGGSVVVPDSVDTVYLSALKTRLEAYLHEDGDRRLVLIVGGGAPARTYQSALRGIVAGADADSQDWIGIMATRLNAELVRACFPGLCADPVVTDPSGPISFSGRILVGAGWKPGFSTDFDSVYLAERFSAKTVINLSNIDKVYDADPKVKADARPLDQIAWKDFRSMVGNNWTPGGNLPFDPIASKRAQELGLTVIAAAGKNLDNLDRILRGQSFTGTRIGPD